MVQEGMNRSLNSCLYCPSITYPAIVSKAKIKVFEKIYIPETSFAIQKIKIIDIFSILCRLRLPKLNFFHIILPTVCILRYCMYKICILPQYYVYTQIYKSKGNNKSPRQTQKFLNRAHGM